MYIHNMLIEKINYKIRQHPVYFHIYDLLVNGHIGNEFHACLCYIHYAEDIHKQLLSDDILPTTVWYKVRYIYTI